MSQWEKLLERICKVSNNLRFEELKNVLEEYGYTMMSPRGGSSHYTFRKPGCASITVPKHYPIKRTYVEMVKKIVESEEVKDEDNRRI